MSHFPFLIYAGRLLTIFTNVQFLYAISTLYIIKIRYYANEWIYSSFLHTFFLCCTSMNVYLPSESDTENQRRLCQRHLLNLTDLQYRGSAGGPRIATCPLRMVKPL